jgi:hypothetical protein
MVLGGEFEAKKNVSRAKFEKGRPDNKGHFST